MSVNSVRGKDDDDTTLTEWLLREACPEVVLSSSRDRDCDVNPRPTKVCENESVGDGVRHVATNTRSFCTLVMVESSHGWIVSGFRFDNIHRHSFAQYPYIYPFVKYTITSLRSHPNCLHLV